MKANELMIADWLLFEGEPIQVSSFDDKYIRFGLGEYKIWRFEPIPLTPEILEKNGWHYDDLVCEWYGPMKLYRGCLNLMARDGIEINYVHELQHALRLCGIEKEIIL